MNLKKENVVNMRTYAFNFSSLFSNEANKLRKNHEK